MENQLSYVNYDYDSLVQQLKDRLRAKNVWKDVNSSATGEMLIELFAYIANLNLYYIERRSEECYLQTAQNKSSVINLVRLLNYSPKRNVSAIGTVQFSIASAALERIFIDQYTRISTAAGVEFVTVAQGTIEKGQTSSTLITVIQGTKQEKSVWNTNNTSNLEINIGETTIENNTHDDVSSFYVVIGGVLWTPVTSFLDSGSSDTHYMVRVELDDTVSVIFGDNLRGKIPESEDEIVIHYVLSDGVDGNVYELDKITTVVAPSISYTYLDSNGITQTATATLSVTNTTTVTGGDDAEDIEEIRREAPNVFKTGDRLVTREDFLAFLYNYPSIAEARVWGEYEDEVGGFAMFNVVKIVLLLEEWQEPTADLKNQIEEAIREKSMLTVGYQWIDADVFNVVVVIDVVVNKKYGLSTTQAEIEALILSAFELGTTALFAENKRISNLINEVDALDSVKYHHMTLEVQEQLSDEVSSGLFVAALKSETVKPETCKIYVGTTHIATDVARTDLSTIGDFIISDSSYDITGTINYTTLEVEVDVSPVLDSPVYIRYQQDADGDVIIGNNGICKLLTTNVTSISY